MCGRYTLLEPNLDSILKMETINELDDFTWTGRYNIAPFQNLPVFSLRKDGKIHLGLHHWDLIPSYTKDLKQKYKMINLKVENITDPQKPYWNRLLKSQRCLIPVSGFYEWQMQPNSKIKKPYYIYLKNKKPFTLAGIWDHWNSPDGKPIQSFTILTCPANPLVAEIHNDKKRMPVILDKKEEQLWLDPNINNLHQLEEVLRPYPSQKMEAYEVTTLVNNARNDDPKCIDPNKHE